MIVYKNNGRYAFRIGDFDSSLQYFVFPHVKSSYKYAWLAERDGRRILTDMRSVLAQETDAEESQPFVPSHQQSAEDMIVGHYLNSFDALVDKSEGVRGADTETRKKVYDEIKIVVQNLLKVRDGLDDASGKGKITKIIGKFSRLTKDNFNDFLTNDSKESKKEAAVAVRRYLHATVADILTDKEEREVLEDIAQRACKALETRLPDTVYMIDPKRRKITLASFDRKIKYVTMSVDSDLLLSSILPHSYLPSSNSGDFYQNIFKPIFESVGHFKLAAKGVLMVSGKTALPDLMEVNASFDVDAIDTTTKELCATTISFTDKRWKAGRKMERSAQATSRYTEMDYLKNGGALVKCIDSELETIFGHTGTIKQVIPMAGNVYMDVDFGHVIVRLVENQIELVNEV